MIIVESAGLSDIGRKRTTNEDCVFVDDTQGLYVVADGMGGHQAGEVASRLAVTSMHEFMRNGHAGAPPLEPPAARSRTADRLLSGIEWSNRVVYREAAAQPDYRGMGTTVAAVCLAEDTLVAANVGDSPIYLVRNGAIDLLSVPHTLQADLPGEPIMAGLGHVLTRAVGTQPEVEPDLCEINCYRGDTLVLCSDGLSTKASPPEIMSLVAGRAPADACRALIDLANARGGEDNVSAIVLHVTGVKRAASSVTSRLTSLIARCRAALGS
jgi:serine/threonine protein phosphatase PrpC